ncbi:hypothetical protein AB0J72_08295 [Dactylosporangium sp. NPDC049742]|uniref:hypothetical protein n=1 Tax=Dactylosporangium sp. NPDC049742 TaxID=3154737 RepID=UPI0034413A0F
MAGPGKSIVEVPLLEVLPRDCAAAVGEIRRLAGELDTHAAGRVAWHWFPEHSRPAGHGDVLLDASITLFNADADWLALTLDLAWSPDLTVNAAVEVACWCRPDHNTHYVRDQTWQVTGGADLVDAFAAGIAMLKPVLDHGPFHPLPWRADAGLPQPTDWAASS